MAFVPVDTTSSTAYPDTTVEPAVPYRYRVSPDGGITWFYSNEVTFVPGFCLAASVALQADLETQAAQATGAAIDFLTTALCDLDAPTLAPSGAEMEFGAPPSDPGFCLAAMVRMQVDLDALPFDKTGESIDFKTSVLVDLSVHRQLIWHGAPLGFLEIVHDGLDWYYNGVLIREAMYGSTHITEWLMR